MNILALPTALAFTMNLTLCLVVLSSKPRDIAHRLFACFVLSFAAWNLGELIMISSINPIRAIFGVRVIFVGLTLKRNRGNVSRTALDVGMGRRQLQNLIRKHRILAREFRGDSSSSR